MSRCEDTVLRHRNEVLRPGGPRCWRCPWGLSVPARRQGSRASWPQRGYICCGMATSWLPVRFLLCFFILPIQSSLYNGMPSCKVSFYLQLVSFWSPWLLLEKYLRILTLRSFGRAKMLFKSNSINLSRLKVQAIIIQFFPQSKRVEFCILANDAFLVLSLKPNFAPRSSLTYFHTELIFFSS